MFDICTCRIVPCHGAFIVSARQGTSWNGKGIGEGLQTGQNTSETKERGTGNGAWTEQRAKVYRVLDLRDRWNNKRWENLENNKNRGNYTDPQGWSIGLRVRCPNSVFVCSSLYVFMDLDLRARLLWSTGLRECSSTPLKDLVPRS